MYDLFYLLKKKENRIKQKRNRYLSRENKRLKNTFINLQTEKKGKLLIMYES